MAYPNVTATQVRVEIAHITTALRSDVKIETNINESRYFVDAKIAKAINLAAVVDLATTPQLIHDCIMYLSRAYVLEAVNSEQYKVASSDDIEYWKTKAREIWEGIVDGTMTVVDANGDAIADAATGGTIETNKRGRDSLHQGPYFGFGPDGEHVVDPNDETAYNNPNP